MKLLILQFVILGLATAAFADDYPYFSITTNQAIEIKQKLDAYEINASKLLDKNGYATANDMGISGIFETNRSAQEEQSRELIGYYLGHTNDVSLKAKLLISYCCIGFGLYSNSIDFTKQYLNIYSNDFRAWNMLGTTYLILKSPDKAIDAYTNSVRLGYKMGYIALAGAAINDDKWDIVQSVIPQLTDLKKVKNLSPDDKHGLVAILLSYAVRTDRKDMFVENFNELDVKDMISSWDDLKQIITYGFKQFKGADIDKIRQEIESASPINSTNNVSGSSN
ncbi:MAG TPA: hypothetical protein VHG89_00480 [Verrucomicrobiae bacterium]|nr:hypothetical protein [Verrucomicrobiae bacterium]